jgi:hypothetical protein
VASASEVIYQPVKARFVLLQIEIQSNSTDEINFDLSDDYDISQQQNEYSTLNRDIVFRRNDVMMIR